ncbi:MAG: hypothetical protein J6B87_00070 [Clostridia bacterium]|nr:hypothetical protein [Clostridia bacterium]
MTNASKSRVKGYSITVVISLKKPVCNTEGPVENIERIFTSLRNYAMLTHQQKVEYDRVRAIAKYASTHGATWCELKSVKEKLHIILNFNDAESMVEFKNGLDSVIESSDMK